MQGQNHTKYALLSLPLII